uniref:L1 transposable element RRM domain-containing protein n=1 Tax=Latimeria chalumnae TaxID=7897 RepID=H3AGF8_LATCH
PASAPDMASMVEIMGDVSSDLKNIAQTLQNLFSAVETLTSIVNEIKEDIKNANQASDSNIVDLKKQVEQLKMRLDNQENRSRCNNLRFLGFPEHVEQDNLVKFLQKTLPTLLQPSTDTDLEIEQAHRSLGPKPAPGQRPRTFVVRFLRFPLKEKTFSLVRNAGKLEWQGHHIQIFPDLSKELQDQRQQFMQVKKKFRNLGIRYGLYYPAVLRISMDGKQH